MIVRIVKNTVKSCYNHIWTPAPSSTCSLKREFPAVPFRNHAHNERSQNTNWRNQELSGMTGELAPLAIKSVWNIYNDFHSVSIPIYVTFLPTRPPLPSLEPWCSAGSGRIRKSSRFHRKFVVRDLDREFSQPFSLKMLQKKDTSLGFFLPKKNR